MSKTEGYKENNLQTTNEELADYIPMNKKRESISKEAVAA